MASPSGPLASSASAPVASPARPLPPSPVLRPAKPLPPSPVLRPARPLPPSPVAGPSRPIPSSSSAPVGDRRAPAAATHLREVPSDRRVGFSISQHHPPKSSSVSHANVERDDDDDEEQDSESDNFEISEEETAPPTTRKHSAPSHRGPASRKQVAAKAKPKAEKSKAKPYRPTKAEDFIETDFGWVLKDWSKLPKPTLKLAPPLAPGQPRPRSKPEVIEHTEVMMALYTRWKNHEHWPENDEVGQYGLPKLFTLVRALPSTKSNSANVLAGPWM